MHGLVALFLEVIALAIILLFVGLVRCNKEDRGVDCLDDNNWVIGCHKYVGCFDGSCNNCGNNAAGSLIMALHGRNMSRLLFLQLLFVLSNLLKNASCFVGRLTLLEENNKLGRVHMHHLVCICKLKLMCLWLRKEHLFTLLFCCGQLHGLMGVATLKIADELYSTLHEHKNWHESGLLGSTKQADQLVTNIGEPCDCLKVIHDAFIEVCLCMVCIVGALLHNDVGPFGQAYILKTLTHQVKQCWTIVLLSIQGLSQNF